VSGRVGRPTRSARALERLVRARLDGVVVDAPMDGITLEVVEAAPDAGWQPGLADRAEAGEPLPDLVARLADQLGDEALVAPVLADAWRPEGAWRAERFPPPPRLFPARGDARARGGAPGDPLEVQEAFEHDLPVPRPSLLLPEPLRLEVACDEGAPVRVRLEHAWRPIERRSGPERLAGEWWDRPFDREYWVVEVEGRTAWIFREASPLPATGSWSLHGWFD
jgi:protein ImuB